jgi:hypothetical protein
MSNILLESSDYQVISTFASKAPTTTPTRDGTISLQHIHSGASFPCLLLLPSTRLRWGITPPHLVPIGSDLSSSDRHYQHYIRNPTSSRISLTPSPPEASYLRHRHNCAKADLTCLNQRDLNNGVHRWFHEPVMALRFHDRVVKAATSAVSNIENALGQRTKMVSKRSSPRLHAMEGGLKGLEVSAFPKVTDYMLPLTSWPSFEG